MDRLAGMDANTLLWITTIVMAVGGMAILLIGKRRTPSEEMQTVLHGIVPLIAACSYFAMSIGQGQVLLSKATADGAKYIFYFARYIDWAFTTPLLLLSLAVTGMHAGHKRAGAITGMLLADVMMIVTGFAFAASTVPWMKLTWFIISCAAFLGVGYAVWISIRQANAEEREDVRSAYRQNALTLSMLWLLYPVVVGLAPEGLGLIGEVTSILCIGILDVVSKVAYGLMVTFSDAKITDRDLAETSRRPLSRMAA